VGKHARTPTDNSQGGNNMNFKIGLMGAMFVGGAAFAADGIKLGGFVNPVYNWAKGTPATNTFGINDGAIYLGKTLGMGEVMVDMPFSSNVMGDGSVDIVAGFAKAQAYVNWKYENGFSWRLGQWDTPFGVEANDSADRFFSKAGGIKAHLPTVHSGLLIGYDFSDTMGLHLIVANPHDTGLMTDGNPDYGAKLSTNMDGMKAALGFLYKTPAVGDSTWLVDVVVGTQMDMLTADIQALIRKDSNLGLGLHLGYGVTEDMKLGVRFEYDKEGDANTIGLGIGPKWTLSKDMTAGVSYYMAKPNVGDMTHSAALSAVHRF